MKESTLEKVERVKNFLYTNNVFVTEHANGHLKVGTVNLWATSEKWLDNSNQEKGVGVSSFLAYLRKNELV